MVFMSAAWIRSLVRQDNLHTPLLTLHSHCGTVAWYDSQNVAWKWQTQEINADNWTGFAGFWRWSKDFIAVPYWSIVLPLAILSGWLLVSGPKAAARPKSPNESAPIAGESNA
jgi:hypothetical protein